MLADLRTRLQNAGISSRAAIAEHPGAAHALARFGADAETVLPPGSARIALENLPAACLRLDAEILARLRRVGLERAEQLFRAPRAPLARRFGDSLLRRLDQALGTVFEPIEPMLPPKTLAHRLAFAEPLLTAESFAAVIEVLTAAVCGKLERAGKGARRLDLLFERVDGHWQAIRVGTARPTRSPVHLARLLRQNLETIDPGLGVEAMQLVVTLAEKLGWTQQETDSAPDHRSDHPGVAELVDRLAGRLGPARVYRAAPVESSGSRAQRPPHRTVGTARARSLAAVAAAPGPADRPAAAGRGHGAAARSSAGRLHLAAHAPSCASRRRAGAGDGRMVAPRRGSRWRARLFCRGRRSRAAILAVSPRRWRGPCYRRLALVSARPFLGDYVLRKHDRELDILP